MATTVQPNIETTPKAFPVSLTPTAVAKVKEIMAQQDPMPAGLRIGVVGGGCSSKMPAASWIRFLVSMSLRCSLMPPL